MVCPYLVGPLTGGWCQCCGPHPSGHALAQMHSSVAEMPTGWDLCIRTSTPYTGIWSVSGTGLRLGMCWIDKDKLTRHRCERKGLDLKLPRVRKQVFVGKGIDFLWQTCKKKCKILLYSWRLLEDLHKWREEENGRLKTTQQAVSTFASMWVRKSEYMPI